MNYTRSGRKWQATYIIGVLQIILLLAALLLAALLFQDTARANATQAATSNQCKLSVPTNRITQAWILQSPCSESDPNEQVFLQAIVFNPFSLRLVEYSPLVVTEGTQPAAPIVPFKGQKGDIVGIFGGGNGGKNVLVGNAGGCVSMVYQTFYCNTPQLFAAINAAHIPIPHLGTTSDGRLCPSTRSFHIVDQDPSDNVQTLYLLTASGQTAQYNQANLAALPGASVQYNGSDNALLAYEDATLGCKPFEIPDMSNGGALTPTQAGDELQAARYQSDPALLPAGDPMTGPNNLYILDKYRVSVDQPPVASLAQASTPLFCKKMIAQQGAYLRHYNNLFSATPAPPFAGGGTLEAFLQSRLQASEQLLECAS